MTMIQFARTVNRTLDLVVTGTGRSGTAFAAQWLISIGIPAGHEMFFSHRGLPAAVRMLTRRYPTVRAECAWEAAPYLASAPLRGALVIHQIRHPKRVIESCMRSPVSRTPKYETFVERHLPMMRAYQSVLNKTACRWIHWNAMIESAVQRRASYIWRLEDGTDGPLQWLDEQGMIDIKNIYSAQMYNNKTLNHHRGEPAEARIEDVHPTLRPALEDMMARHGYDRWDNGL